MKTNLWPRGKVLWAAFALGQIAAFGLTWLALTQPLYAAALVYVALFWALTWNRPWLAMLSIFALAPFQNDLGGDAGAVKFSLSEINLALTIPVLLLQNWAGRRPLVPGPAALAVALYGVVCVLSSLFSWRPTALLSLVQMALYLGFGVLIFSSLAKRGDEFLPALNVLVCAGVFLALAGIVTRSQYFLGLTKNGVGASLSCAFLVCVELWFLAKSPARRNLLMAAMAIIVAGLVLILSRGAWLGAVCGVLFIMARRGQWRVLGRAALVLVPIIALSWSALPPESRSYATGLSRKDWNIYARLENDKFAQQQWEKNPILGVGVGLRKEYDATNVAWTTLAETGVIGLCAFALIHFVFLRAVWTHTKYFAPDEIAHSLLLLGAALLIRQLAHGLVDHYWARGPLAIAWAAVGMAAWAWAIAQRKRVRFIRGFST